MEEIDIREIFHPIQKRIWVIIAIVVFFAVAAGIISTFFLRATPYNTHIGNNDLEKSQKDYSNTNFNLLGHP